MEDSPPGDTTTFHNAAKWRPLPDSNRNRRFRKPELYPVELRGLDLEQFSSSNFARKLPVATVLRMNSGIQGYMLVRARIKPIAIVAALVIMIAALVYVAMNRSHEVSPSPPLHQAR